MSVLAIAERRDGNLRQTSLEVLTAGRALAEAWGSELVAVLLGPPGIGDESKKLAAYGVITSYSIHYTKLYDTIPEVAMVGLTEEQAREKYDVRVGRFDFAANGRAMASGDNLGFVKVIADAKYGEILGVHIVGPTAAEMINQAVV